MLPFSMDDILNVFKELMTAFKKIMAWLGILVLPEDGEYDDYPTRPAADDDANP